MLEIIFGTVLPWVLVGLLCWFGYQLILQNGRVLLRLDEITARLDQLKTAGGAAPVPDGPPPGLPVGTEAPAFDLPDLDGARHTLAQYRGRRVIVTFYSTQCGFCTEMLPRLAAQAQKRDGPVVLVITSGSAEENRRQMKEHGVKCPVLLQSGMEVYTAYQANGTPTGYLIDEQGKIAAGQAIGADALLALGDPQAGTPAPAAPCQGGPTESANGHGDPHAGTPARGKANRGLHTSKLVRDGLKAGTTAPAFRLPRLDGGELALKEYRGRRVLLVFSDPQCGPCDQVAPQLEQLHRQRPDLRVLMVSRRDADENRRKVKQLGLTFPVVLQKSWEISKLYGMFATPIGYLIDDKGVIAADVAVGGDAILALASGPAAPSANGPAASRAAGGPPRGEEVMTMPG